MRIAPALLLPAAWLALTGAAAPSLTDAAECRLPCAEAHALLATLPTTKHVDQSVAPGRRIANYYAGPMPRAFGFQASSFGSTDMLDDDSERFMVITSFKLPFDQVRAAAIKVHGEAACPIGDRATFCMGTVRTEPDWTVSMLISEDDGEVSIGCAYRRDPTK